MSTTIKTRYVYRDGKMVPEGPPEVAHTNAWPVGASLADMHRLHGHRHAWRCALAIGFYRLGHKVMWLGDKVGCWR